MFSNLLSLLKNKVNIENVRVIIIVIASDLISLHHENINNLYFL